MSAEQAIQIAAELNLAIQDALLRNSKSSITKTLFPSLHSKLGCQPLKGMPFMTNSMPLTHGNLWIFARREITYILELRTLRTGHTLAVIGIATVTAVDWKLDFPGYRLQGNGGSSSPQIPPDPPSLY
ncbi:uncharacterized protein N7479_000389 [Penicillium vulpinum]|uniref:Uncharacterized protein n=1 Tax=Penicillium vulpinum TaxID=29845 RepID=A0A1V6S5M7_9EURO|nr:uncharacterized protein N7479_000389 [Penicillium vulpinum]KAJ5970471.1 hypothetical protein N7479_000389 [Penicillium vulpinum]OQE09029.1 hypothetical protein PENVUL_c007G05985 [Penicillium vulpinum]